jgi:hypothetical protein
MENELTELRDRLAIEIVKIMLSMTTNMLLGDVEMLMTRAYPLADSVLSGRNISAAKITKDKG